jgi:two-component system NtrC family sensor kinase
LTVIDSEVHRCKRIIEGLLDFARVRPVEKARLEMSAIADQALALMSLQERFRRRITLRREMTPGLFVHANVDRVTQVLLSLLGNASDAIEDKGAITVRVRRGDGATVLTEVVDDGKGIPRAQLRRIFEPFFTTKAPGKGTGLGLSICYGIIAEHAGRIEVESTVGAGSVFRIVLPELA